MAYDDISERLILEIEKRQDKYVFDDIEAVVERIVKSSPWFVSRIEPARPGGWVSYVSSRNVSTSIQSITYGTPSLGVPKSASIVVDRRRNCTDQEQQRSIRWTRRNKAVVSVAIKNGFRTTNELKINFAITPPAAKFLNVKVDTLNKLEIDFSKSTSSIDEEEDTIEISETIRTPPWKMVSVFATEKLGLAEMPFQAAVLINAEAYLKWYNPNNRLPHGHGHWLPFEKLLVDDHSRTFHLTGTLYNATYRVSEAWYTQKELNAQSPECQEPEH